MMDTSVYRLWTLAIFICLWRIGKAVPENCCQELFSYSGSISSLNYPHPYPSGRNCTWVISTIANFKVQLMFETVDLENDTSCKYDYITVFDGISDQDRVMGKFCGHKVPMPLVASKNAMLIVFVSDARVEGSGFKATYNTVMCGQNFNQIVGIFKSPEFPENYMGYRKCIWTIETDRHQQLSLSFSQLEVSNSSDCSSEYVDIYSISDEIRTLPSNISNLSPSGGRLLTRICGNNATKQITDDIRSTSSKMYVVFTSEGPIQGIKFQASFSSDLDECAINNGGCEYVCKNTNGSYTCECPEGSFLNTDRHSCQKECSFNFSLVDKGGSTFQSPNYPNDYPSNKVCDYLLHTLPGNRINLIFTAFGLERPWDFVTAYDGMSNKSALLGNFTGYAASLDSNRIQSSANYLYLVFKSDYLYERVGFNASVSPFCGRDYGALVTSGVIYSHPQYGRDKYENNLACSWRLEGKNKSDVKLWFTEFDLELHGDCVKDYIEIIDRRRESMKSFGKFCGTKLPGEFVSTYGILYLEFKTNAASRHGGFKAMYETVP